MKYLFATFLFLASSVSAQTPAINGWNEFSEDVAGFSILAPCAPVTTTLTVSEKPKLVRNFIFECKSGNFRFAILVSEPLRAFDQREAEAAVDGWEVSRARTAEGKASIDFKRSHFQTYKASLANLKSDFGLQREFHVVHPKASYTVLISFRSHGSPGVSDGESRDFDFSAGRFFDSFVIK